MPRNERKSVWEKIQIAYQKAMNSAVVKKWETSVNKLVGFSFNFGKITGVIAWVTVSTLLVSVVPLFLEIDREHSVIEAEKRQVAKLRQRGYSSQQISMLQSQTQIPLQ